MFQRHLNKSKSYVAIGIAILWSFIFVINVSAQTDCVLGDLEAPLPGLEGQTVCDIAKNASFIGYMQIIINFATALIVAIGIITVVVAGYIYMTAGGDAGRVGLAKQFLSAALLGIFLALTSYLILNTISSQFTSDVKEPTLILPNTK